MIILITGQGRSNYGFIISCLDNGERYNNPDYWISKIERNKERDSEINKKLTYLDWTVIRFWGEEIKKDIEGCVGVVREAIIENLILL